ncbi:tetratricopeptide repeat protein [Rheinheimera soli]|uniref:Tetratricopeptide (TPR) repeat protein n=1 Tax=Rheinheimera soli TaxID=443616 RepID=A0ABU1W515_9GAMM|nr:tetratricopeptide repeat protein [Rheinheimera soli]MDR7123066.1 tetratricopeptide (TPR) repeat protein [Rheinheimera soli]
MFPTDPKSLMQKALMFYQTQQFEQALLLFQPLSQNFPKTAQVWHLKALTERKLDKTTASLHSFETALALDPSNHEVMNNFANLLKQLGEWSRALQLLQRSIQLQPGYFDAHYNAGLLLLQQLRPQDALPFLGRSVLLRPDHADALLAKVRAMEKLGQHDHAVIVLKDFLQEQPAKPQLWLMLVLLLRQQGNYSAALQNATLALHHNPQQRLLETEYATLLFLSGDTMTAQIKLQKLLSDSPTDLKLLHLLSDICWLSNEADPFSCYRLAMEQAPAETKLYNAYIQKLIKAGQLDEAEEVTDSYLELHNHSHALLFKGFLRRQANDLPSALSALTQVKDKQPPSAELRNELALCYLSLQNYSEAIAIYQSMVRDYPADQAWYAHLASAYKLAGQDRAYRQLYDFDRFIQIRPISLPFGFTSVAQFNQQLLQLVVQLHHNSCHPLEQSLRHGTQTEDHLFLRQEPLIQLLKQHITEQVRLYIESLPEDNGHPFLCRKAKDFLYTGAWSVRLNNSGFHKNHYHSEGWISGCYYIDVPDRVEQQGQGWIKFGQAEFHQALMMEPDFLIKPDAGVVVLFPSMMWHGTQPFSGSQYRVTVAFDLIPQ